MKMSWGEIAEICFNGALILGAIGTVVFGSAAGIAVAFMALLVWVIYLMSN